jgi:hypothetical protein
MSFRPHPDDRTWWRRFAVKLSLLDDAPKPGEQLAVIQLDDLPKNPPGKYIPCPQRGLHDKLVDCWMCWCDVMSGSARLKDVLRQRSSR